MSPHEALNVIAQVAAKFVGTLEDHKAVQTALQVIGEALKPADAANAAEGGSSD